MKPLAGGAINNAKLAIKYILSKEYIDVAIPGMDSVDQVLENISVLENLDIDKEDELKIEDIRSQLGNRFCRRCEYCMPCPVGINIPMNFLLEGYYSRYNLKEWSKERYNSLDIKASDCVECGKCESKCPYDLPIREMLKEVTEKLD
ncbi:aldo/keto reductase family protein [[Clostridium] sordellii ATCC 9714]|nr:aldo/keto reductase family protein [[Clostridium] sordellii ATCC 9714] [Paeniclostridium sordellii ATCC 9714]